MQQHTTSTSTKIACFASLFIGVLSAIYSFITKNHEMALYFGIGAVVIGAASAIRARRNIDDTQVAAAGIFMAAVACVVAITQMHNF